MNINVVQTINRIGSTKEVCVVHLVRDVNVQPTYPSSTLHGCYLYIDMFLEIKAHNFEILFMKKQ